jgi:anti-sigma B factor antagonist
LAVVPRLTEALRDAQHEARLVVLDLRELTFLDTAGVHAIVDAGFDARCDGRRLFLVGAPARVQRVFGLTATSHQVNVFDGSPGELPVQAFFQLARRSIPA